MPNRCSFCRVKNPTNHLILTTPVGVQWIEFCERCGEREEMQRMTDDGLLVKSVRELYDDAAQARIKKERKGS